MNVLQPPPHAQEFVSCLPSYAALVSLLTIALYFFIATRVAAVHRKFGVKLPAMTGHPDFERIYRTHANMLEWFRL